MQTHRTRHVVVVDDSPVVLVHEVTILDELPDVAIQPFTSSREALAWSAQSPVDCFVLDYHMPEPDGLEMTRMIRLDPRLAGVPIVIVTAEDDPAVRTNVLRAGANDYVTKPAQPLELIARLTTLLALHDARKALAMQVDELESSLMTAEQRARAHAARLEALWGVANNPTLRGDGRMQAMLKQAASAIRTDHAFRGLLGRLEGDEVRLLAMSPLPGDDRSSEILEIGGCAKIEGTIVSVVARTQAWNDLTALDPAPASVTALGWRSVISTQFTAGASRYSMSFASTEPVAVPFGPDDYAYVELLAAFFANHLEVTALERSLRDSEQRSRAHAERLEALSRIVNNPSLGDDERLDAMLREAATAIRPGQPFRGMLARVEERDVVLEAFAESAETNVPGNFLRSIGNRRPMSGSLVEALMRSGKATAAWDDLMAPGGLRAAGGRSDWRAFICTIFQAGGATHTLSFGSREPVRVPFGPQDDTYVEIIASFFANHLHQRWQFDRIQYQQHYDVLTGLLNRSQFRARARTACLPPAERFGVVIVNVSGFRRVNERHGHMIGDAMLVEVATALRSSSGDGELVGRLGGDVFAVCLPGASKTEAERRALAVGAIFEHPFSTGDREGTEFIALAGCVGFAAAPDDGASFETVLACAEQALLVAKAGGPGTTAGFTTRSSGA